MKKVLFILLTVIVMTSCANADGVVKIYEKGCDKVYRATSKQELSDITYDVKRDLMNYSKRPGGKRKMNLRDSNKVSYARDRFNQAVASKAAQLQR